jgi:uncharacterized surface protein with fasciclin (FAS1) repeats
MSAQDQTTAAQGTGLAENLKAGDILETARQIPEISDFLKAVQQAGMETELRAVSMRTLFAPVNSAFKITGSAADAISKYIVQGRQTEADLRTTKAVKSMSGEAIPVEFRSEGSRFGGAKIVRRDIPCTNGMIQLIDGMVS